MRLSENGVPATSSSSARSAVEAWRAFADRIQVSGPSEVVSWTDYLRRYPNGRADERSLVGPVVFPAFVEQILGYEVGQTLAAEVSGAEGRPDYTPADAATHPFVFEVKGTDGQQALQGHNEQVTRYLRDGRDRIKHVVLTNVSGLRIFALSDDGLAAREVLNINLRALAIIPAQEAIQHEHARRLASFISQYQFRRLTTAEKIDRIRRAPKWNPTLETTATGWVLQRLDSVVETIRADVTAKVSSGDLLDPATLPDSDRPMVERELRELDKRIGSTDADANARSLRGYLAAAAGTKAHLAVEQFAAHTAFYTATRLLLVRAWEDIGLLDPAALYNGGFDRLMTALDDVRTVVATAFERAGERYPDLFRRHNAFSWYRPTKEVYVEAIYDLANTYLGDLSDDVLGEVYQRQLARVDRKQLGQYYTPRDVIKTMWDLIDLDRLADAADAEDRPLRMLDIATGSGGFLVHGAARLRGRFQRARAAGDTRPAVAWVRDAADGLIGCEVQQFSAYLAEVNLVLQFSPLLSGEPDLRLPPLRIHCADTLTLHNPDETALAIDGETDDGRGAVRDVGGLQVPTDITVRQSSLDRLRDPSDSGEWLDIAIGNPPYVGEKSIAATLATLQADHPYWRRFSASHADYLYNFLILGVSKLRRGGRFAFITTEYWLKATGAAPLRAYLAEHTRIERLVLFRDLTLFPDAPGQHNLIVVGERVTDPAGTPPADAEQSVSRPASTSAERDVPAKPKISIYVGPAKPVDRRPTLDAVSTGRHAPTSALLRTYASRRDPASLGAASWAEVTMHQDDLRRRDAIRRIKPKAGLVMSEGVIATPQRLKTDHAPHLTAAALAGAGGADSKAGIFLLTAAEKAALSARAGGLTEAETEHLRPVVNTRDIFPYGAVVPSDGDHLIWLPHSHGGDDKQFPDDMPTVEAHLRQFKPLLEHTVAGYKATRPWWSAHRARVELVEGHPDTGHWADLAVTARWGGRRLVTALAPAHSLPASGLHALTGSGATSAAYLVGLINSTPVQDVAAALAPGSVGQNDITRLGLPQFPQPQASGVEERVRQIADVVRTLVTQHGPRWPLLPDVLRGDITLTNESTAAWSPTVATRGWGTLESVAWVRAEVSSRVSGVLESSDLTEDLLGRRLTLHFTRGAIHLEADDHPQHDLRMLLRACILGRPRLRPSDVLSLPLPVQVATLVSAYDKDLAAVDGLTATYRRLREEIDEIVIAALER